jgi:hypothetical protein
MKMWRWKVRDSRGCLGESGAESPHSMEEYEERGAGLEYPAG